MPFTRNKILSVFVILIVLTTVVSIVFLIQQPTNDNEDEVRNIALTITVGDNDANYTIDELMTLPSTSGLGSFVRTGVSPPTFSDPYNYTGVNILDLLTGVGTLPENYSLEVLSSDGYTTYFNKSEVHGVLEAYNSTTGEPIGPRNFTMIVAYMEGEEMIAEEYGGPLRVVILPEGEYLSAGHSWPKYVANLTIIDDTEPWSLELDGVTPWNMTHDVYYSLGSCPHHRKDIAQEDIVYSGVTLWTLIASMDGGTDDHYSFNSSLISTNYTVTVWSGTGASISFTSYEVAYNNSLLIVGWADEELLKAPDWPLLLVTSDGYLLGNIVRIVMTGWN
jgi:hypothetical protein